MSERTSSGISAMEAQAAEAIAKNAAARQQQIDQAHTEALVMNAGYDAAQQATQKQEAIEARANSAEVAALNDKAELEIFGSKGRTFTDPANGEVIATPERPIKGKLEEIKSSPRFGKTKSKRELAAKEYLASLEELQTEGLELCQAKIVLDLRESDWDNIHKLAAKFMAEGDEPANAQQKAAVIYVAIDQKRVELIQTKGVFTAEEYDRVRKGEEINLTTPETEEETVNDPAGADPDVIEKSDTEDAADTDADSAEELTDEEINEAAKAVICAKNLGANDEGKARRKEADQNFDKVMSQLQEKQDWNDDEAAVMREKLLGEAEEDLAAENRQRAEEDESSEKVGWKQKASNFRQRVSRIKDNVAFAPVFVKDAVRERITGNKIDYRDHEANEEKSKKRRAMLIGAGVLALAGVAAVSYANRRGVDVSDWASGLFDIDSPLEVSFDEADTADGATGDGGGNEGQNSTEGKKKSGNRGQSGDSMTGSGEGEANNGQDKGGIGSPENDGEKVKRVQIDAGEGTSHIARDNLGINFDSVDQWNEFNSRTNSLFEGLDGVYFDGFTDEYRISNPGNFRIPQEILEEMEKVAKDIKSKG